MLDRRRVYQRSGLSRVRGERSPIGRGLGLGVLGLGPGVLACS